MEKEILSSPMIQMGFAGLCLILLCINVWLVSKLLEVINNNTKAFCANMEAINNNTKMIEEQKTISKEVRDLLLCKPCIAERRS